MADKVVCPKWGHCRAKTACPLGAFRPPMQVFLTDRQRNPCPVRHSQEVVPLPSPSIILSCKRGPGYSASYSPTANRIKLRGAGRSPEDLEGFLSHELAHWATFLMMTPEERTFTVSAYSAQTRGGVPHNERVLEKIAFQISGWY